MRPIRFEAPIVRAVLQGRKTESRDPIPRFPAGGQVKELFKGRWEHTPDGGTDQDAVTQDNPFHDNSGRLFVKEDWCIHELREVDRSLRIKYIADQQCSPWLQDPYDVERILFEKYWNETHHDLGYSWDEKQEKWLEADTRSPYDVPRIRVGGSMSQWASRITLELISAWVERLHDITDDGAIAEGIYERHAIGDDPASAPWTWQRHGWRYDNPREAYAALWDATHGRTPGLTWKDNPWVWVIEHKRLHP